MRRAASISCPYRIYRNHQGTGQVIYLVQPRILPIIARCHCLRCLIHLSALKRIITHLEAWEERKKEMDMEVQRQNALMKMGNEIIKGFNNIGKQRR